MFDDQRTTVLLVPICDQIGPDVCGGKITPLKAVRVPVLILVRMVKFGPVIRPDARLIAT